MLISFNGLSAMMILAIDFPLPMGSKFHGTDSLNHHSR
jgi:hypothetical protein